MRKFLNIISRPYVFLPLVLVTCFGVGTVAVLVLLSYQANRQSSAEFKTFASCGELVDYLNQGYNKYYYLTPGRAVDDGAVSEGSGSGTTGGGSAPTYSSTNVQVQGVDEADSTKTNGKNIFTISNNKVFILQPDSGNLTNLKELTTSAAPRELLVNGDRLIVITDASGYWGVKPLSVDLSVPYYSNTSQVGMEIYDISVPAEPKLERHLVVDGTYTTSRMIGDYVYVVSNYSPYNYSLIEESQLDTVLPRFADVQGREVVETDLRVLANCSEISHYGNSGRSFTNVLSVDLSGADSGHRVLVGGTQNIFASAQNLYVTAPVYPEAPVYESCSTWQAYLFGCVTPTVSVNYNDISTAIFKLSLDKTDVSFRAEGDVKGTLLNQFSMDEHSGYFRVATTSTDARGTQLNNLYVLDENMNTVGKLEGLARTERIYSVRFIGDRAYMVTYKNVDPLFVISLADPKNPTVLGELKIPGFSNYLHPYDENHIIGFGRDTQDQGSFATLKGLKIGLFDVTDPENPVEISTYSVGGRGSDSALLSDHKALLFDREKNLIVLPAALYPDLVTDYLQPDFNGFIVLNVDTATGLKERGRIAHTPISPTLYYYVANPRSLHIDNYLYTIMDETIKGSQLSDLHEVAEETLR